MPKYATKINMCDTKCCQWVFLTDSEQSFFFFFPLLMLSCEVYFCCPSICSGNDLLGCAPSKGNWQTGTSFPTADAQLSHANLCLLPSLLSHLQSGLLHLSKLMLPVCKKRLMKLGMQSCNIVLWESRKGRPSWQVLNWAARQWDQNVELLSATNGKCVQKYSTPWHLDFLIRFHSLGVLEIEEADRDR